MVEKEPSNTSTIFFRQIVILSGYLVSDGLSWACNGTLGWDTSTHLKKKKNITSVLYQHSYCCTLPHKQSSAQPTYKNSTLWGKKITACPTSNYQHGCVCGLICAELHKREENILNVSLGPSWIGEKGEKKGKWLGKIKCKGREGVKKIVMWK